MNCCQTLLSTSTCGATSRRADRILYENDGTLKPYVLNVTLNGSHITGSPFDLTLQPAGAGHSSTSQLNLSRFCHKRHSA